MIESGSIHRLPDAEAERENMEQLGLRERKKLIRLRRILQAAEKLFVDKGFTNTTIKDIAVEADVGLGTLYLYAKSKEDLLVLVFKQHILEMIDTSFARSNPEDSLLEQFMSFFDGHIEYHRKDRALSRTVLKELSFSHTEQRRQDIEQIMWASYSKLRELVSRAAQQPGAQDSAAVRFAGTTAWSAFALYYHLLQGFLCGFLSEEHFRKNLRNALAMLLNEDMDAS